MQTAESLRKLEAYLLKKHVSGSIETVRNVLQRASAALPSNPLSDSERYREVVPSHQLPDTPVRTVAELDAGGLEIRKIDTYADGAMDYAVRSIETGTTRLNGRLPGSADVVRLISAAEFLKLWQQAIDQAQPRGLITVVENPNATDQDHGH
jgi:hypothetical protein